MHLVESLGNCGLKVNFKPHETVVMIGKCENEGNLARRIQNIAREDLVQKILKFTLPMVATKPFMDMCTWGCQLVASSFAGHNIRETCKCDSQVTSVNRDGITCIGLSDRSLPTGTGKWQMCPSAVQEALPDIVAILKTTLNLKKLETMMSSLEAENY